MAKSIILSLVFAVAVAAQSDDAKTGDFVNGRFWGQSLEAIKVGYLFGLRDGLLLIAADNKSETVKNALMLSMLLYRDGKATLEELIDQIDTFYKDRANIRIPVFEAYQYCMKRTSGVSKKTLDDLLAEMRSRAARF
jgi:hypothetical protein